MQCNAVKEEAMKPTENFVSMFVDRFGPRNYTNLNAYPIIRRGSYGKLNFDIIETRTSYSVKVGNKARKFNSGLEAAFWVYDRIRLINRD